MRPPSISVVIPARDASPTLERTLAALRAQECTEPYEVIVVDDGSRDDTAGIARRHEQFAKLVHFERSQGPGAARNHGVSSAAAPVLAFTDADCFPHPMWLAHGLEALAHADIVQGAVRPEPAVTRTPFDRTVAVERGEGFYETANLFVKRELFDRVGGFRDWAMERRGRRFAEDRRRDRATRTPIGEDTLFAWSARRLGARTVYAPTALVFHAVVPGTLRDAIADRWHWTRDMPGLAQLVPELRDAIFYRRWFFAYWTATFDLAVLSLAALTLTRRRWCLVGLFPYIRRVYHEATVYRAMPGTAWERARSAAMYALGAPAVDAATLAGLVVGSIAWRCIVL